SKAAGSGVTDRFFDWVARDARNGRSFFLAAAIDVEERFPRMKRQNKAWTVLINPLYQGLIFGLGVSLGSGVVARSCDLSTPVVCGQIAIQINSGSILSLAGDHTIKVKHRNQGELQFERKIGRKATQKGLS